MKGFILFLLTAVATLDIVSPFPAAADTTGSTKELQRIKREMGEKKKAVARADKQERSILGDLDRIDRQVQEGKADLAEQYKKLKEAELSLKSVEQNSSAITAELADQKRLYALRLRALYKMSRNGSAASLLFSTADGSALKRIKYLGMIADRDRTIMREYGNTLAALERKQAELSEKRAGLIARKRAIEGKKSELEERKRRKAVLLASVRKEKDLSRETLHELEESSANLWAMIRRSEEERKVRPSSPPPVSAGRGRERLPWPVEGRVLTRFGMQLHPQFKTKVFRRGIEIAAREGEPVRAVGEGRIAFADWYKGYGKLLIIEHAPGFYTLYGNLSQLDLNKGDRVMKGQVIGLAGDTGSLKGSKLYFEMRRNGEAQDPLLWLAKR